MSRVCFVVVCVFVCVLFIVLWDRIVGVGCVVCLYVVYVCVVCSYAYVCIVCVLCLSMYVLSVPCGVLICVCFDLFMCYCFSCGVVFVIVSGSSRCACSV